MDEERYKTQIRAYTQHRHEIRPEDFFISNLLVVPPSIRPYTKSGREIAHDDLTSMSSNIIKKTKTFQNAKTDTSRQKAMDALQNEVNCYLSQKTETGMGGQRKLMTICQRLKGKKGQIRSGMEATRRDYSSRSVLGPDPMLKVGEVGIPQAMTKMTQTVRVAKFNIKHWNKVLKEDLRLMTVAEKNQKAEHEMMKGGMRIFSGEKSMTNYEPCIQFIRRGPSKKNTRVKKISELRIGDVLDVRIRDGMMVTLNRQPTIRVKSISGHRVVVHKDPTKQTITFNPSVCTCYNAD